MKAHRDISIHTTWNLDELTAHQSEMKIDVRCRNCLSCSSCSEERDSGRSFEAWLSKPKKCC